MKTLKFRAWDNENKCYFKPTYEAYKGNVEDLNIGLDGDLYIKKIVKSTHYNQITINRFILEQFTGLQDKNGKDVYEGDIVEYGETYIGDYCEKEGHGEIQYEDGCFIVVMGAYHDQGFELDGVTIQNRSIKIIGNIHENPELLNGNN